MPVKQARDSRFQRQYPFEYEQHSRYVVLSRKGLSRHCNDDKKAAVLVLRGTRDTVFPVAMEFLLVASRQS